MVATTVRYRVTGTFEINTRKPSEKVDINICSKVSQIRYTRQHPYEPQVAHSETGVSISLPNKFNQIYYA